jgi:hypothetical protein
MVVMALILRMKLMVLIKVKYSISNIRENNNYG